MSHVITTAARTAPGASGRFAARSMVSLAGVLLLGVLFALVLTLVAARWAPLRTLDVAVVDAVNDEVSQQPTLATVLRVITDLGGTSAAVVLVSLAVVWLLVRRLPRLAVYAAATGLGAAVLNVGVKALVDRARPLVDTPVAAAPGGSFPSGHAMGSTIAYGVLLLVFLPVVPSRFRRAVAAAVVTLVVAIGLTRIALAVHYPSDVLGGWLLGIIWLAVTAAAFRHWRTEEGLQPAPIGGGLAPEDRAALVPSPAHDALVPAGARGVAVLLVAGVGIWGVMLVLGLRVITWRPVARLDAAVADAVFGLRTDALTSVLSLVNRLGSTVWVLVVLAAAASLALAVTRRWAPPVFLVVAAVGETALYLAVSRIVDRPRPAPGPAFPELPAMASFPSGHVAAAVVTYGGIAMLVLAWSRSRLRYAAPVLAVLAVVGMALSRVYRGVHHPSDTLASVLYASAWLGVCWFVFRPGRPSGRLRSSAGSSWWLLPAQAGPVA